MFLMSVRFVVKMSLIACLLHFVMGNQTLVNNTTATHSHNATGNPMTEIKTKNVIILVVILLLFVVSMVGAYYVTSSDFSFTKSERTKKCARNTPRSAKKQKKCCQYVPMVQPDDADCAQYEADPLLS
ncbi:hypothetical protein PPYR_05835 [Photinus pyralis]|uniref:Uncharacterized protein n=1 Tax=Photinus pyralis TaxID=7054 RepID=A0A5N4AVW9_PHOPY|nr:uncharacterized protein LOC116166212 [Photinus pyralis]KAB0801481.1 hypothetical protein PPYR_05835 [Photinus pyralis]